MDITFLGTGTSQGVPVIACDCEVCRSIDYKDKRYRSSVHIDYNHTSIVIDTGPDFRSQILREKIKRLDAVLFTHEHKDHTAGLDEVRSFNFAQKTDIPIYGRDRVIDQLKKEFAYAFGEKKYPGTPEITPHIITKDKFDIIGLEIQPIDVMHMKLPVFGFRIKDFTYITDANYISDEQKELIKGSKLLVLNALQKDPHISHFTLDQAVQLAQELGVEKTYLTHISHKLGKHRNVSKELPDNVELAFDGLKITV